MTAAIFGELSRVKLDRLAWRRPFLPSQCEEVSAIWHFDPPVLARDDRRRALGAVLDGRDFAISKNARS